MLRISFDGSDTRLIAALRSKPMAIAERLRTTLDQLDLRLQSRIVAKLEGQVLHSHTHNLQRSIRMLPAAIEAGGKKIVGYVLGGGGVAWYAIIHEKTGSAPHDIVAVNKKALAFIPSSITVRAGLSLAKQSLAMVIVKRVHHPGTQPMPFMAPTLEEMRSEIVSELQRALGEAISGA